MNLPDPVKPTRPWLSLLAIVFCAEAVFLALFVEPRSDAPDFYHVNFVPAAVHRGFNVYDYTEHASIVKWIDDSRTDDDSKRLRGCYNINQRLYPTGFCPTATPFLYSVHSPALVGSFDVRFWLFHLTATALCIIGLFQLARASGFDKPTSWLVGGLIMSFCWGLFLDTQLANVSRIQIFGLAVALTAARSNHKWGIALAGFALAVGCAYKPTILPSVSFWLFVLVVDRRWREVCTGLGGLAFGAAISFVFPLVLFDSLDCWWQWKQFAGAELSALATSFPGNYSLSSALVAQGQPWALALPWIFGGALIIAFAATTCPSAENGEAKERRDLRLGLAIAVGPLWAILASPLTWVQYSALAMPLVIVLMGATRCLKSSRGIWLAAVIVAAILSGGMPQRFISIESFWLDAGILWIGWLGLLLATIWLLKSMPQANPASVKAAEGRQHLEIGFRRIGLGS